MVVANQLDTTYQTYTIWLPQSFSLLVSNSHQYYKTNSNKIWNGSVLSKSVTENLYTTIQRAENIGLYFVRAKHKSTDIFDIQLPRLWRLKHDVCVCDPSYFVYVKTSLDFIISASHKLRYWGLRAFEQRDYDTELSKQHTVQKDLGVQRNQQTFLVRICAPG